MAVFAKYCQSRGRVWPVSAASARLPRPPWEWRLSPASASPSPSLAKTPEDGNNGGQGGLGWGKGESQDNPADTLGHSSMVTDI